MSKNIGCFANDFATAVVGDVLFDHGFRKTAVEFKLQAGQSRGLAQEAI